MIFLLVSNPQTPNWVEVYYQKTAINEYMPSPVITLTSDFGLTDPYAAEMKAVILSINPEAAIVDISHCVEKYDIRMGAYILARATPYFPKGSVHVAVIDPGVGTKRRPLLIQTNNGYYLGPDNGVLSLAAITDGIQHIREITKSKVMLGHISKTFHGRDIFASAAAHLTKGTKPGEFGPETSEFVVRTFATKIKRGNSLAGEILYTDSFGNIVTNFTKENLEKVSVRGTVEIEISNRKLKFKVRRTYAESESSEPFAIMGSHGFLEISKNKASAARALKTRIGDRICLMTG